MPISENTELVQQTKSAVLKAGSMIREQWSEPKCIRHKGRIDLVTQTDLQVEEFLKTECQKILPQAGFLAEETAGSGTLGESTWVIDPLDGTTNFAHNLFGVAVSVALWQRDRIQTAFVYLPLTGEMFQAARGEGAFLNGRAIHVSQEQDLAQSLIATGFPYNIRDRIDEVLPAFKKVLTRCRGLRRMGSAALDLAYTACGRFDGFYELGLKPWDTAAGWLLVEEAGGRVSRFSPEKEYDLGADTILASNGLIHQDLASLLLEAGSSGKG